MPEEVIFAEPGREGRPPAAMRLMHVRGRAVLCEEARDGWRVVRLLSTDPADFLAPELAPGALLPPPAPHRSERSGSRSEGGCQGW